MAVTDSIMTPGGIFNIASLLIGIVSSFCSLHSQTISRNILSARVGFLDNRIRAFSTTLPVQSIMYISTPFQALLGHDLQPPHSYHTSITLGEETLYLGIKTCTEYMEKSCVPDPTNYPSSPERLGKISTCILKAAVSSKKASLQRT